MFDLYAFDLDGTLTKSKLPIDSEVQQLLKQLLQTKNVAIISGGGLEIVSQVMDRLPGFPNLHILPTCGTQYYKWVGAGQNGAWELQYCEMLTETERDTAIQALNVAAKELGFDLLEARGAKIEDRGSQITYSALGQEASYEDKMAWDVTGEKRESLAKLAGQQIPELDVRPGGSTSVDVTRKGVDKGYGIRRLSEITSIPLEKMYYIGDKMTPPGNDYPVTLVLEHTKSVKSVEETKALLKEELTGVQASPSHHIAS